MPSPTDAPTETTVAVWWATPVDPCPAVLALLDDAEQARHLRLKRPEDRAAHASAHALLRLVLGRLLGREPVSLRLDRNCRGCGAADHGKPHLIGGGPEFSLTHSRGRVGVAVAIVPIGLDVEGLDRYRPDPAMEAEVLTAAERAALASLEPDERAQGFLRFWTRKEALLKATGLGLTVPLRELPVESATVGDGLRVWDLDPGPGFVGALAAQSDVDLTISQFAVEDLLG